jgi:hypothetical protein
MCHDRYCAGEVSDVLKQLYSTFSLVQRYSVDALGQIQVYPGAPICNSNSTDALTSNATVACKSPFIVSKS